MPEGKHKFIVVLSKLTRLSEQAKVLNLDRFFTIAISYFLFFQAKNFYPPYQATINEEPNDQVSWRTWCKKLN